MGILRQPIVALVLAKNEPGHRRRLGEVSGRAQPIPTPRDGGLGVDAPSRWLGIVAGLGGGVIGRGWGC